MKKFKKVLFSIAYWLLSLTWGGLMTIPGLLITGFCILFLKGKPHRNGCSYIVEMDDNWGGLEIGGVSLCGGYSKEDSPCRSPEWFEHIRRHEFGHGVQQLALGPLQIFLVWIPSVIRYWYGKLHGLKHPYDYAIFEYTASKYGYYWVGKLEDSPLEYTYKRHDV